MDIEDAFTQEAIAVADTNVAGDDEEYLRQMARRICAENEIPPMDEQHEQLALLFFVAGRTYQSDLSSEEPESIEIEMTPRTAREFIRFLTEKGAP